MDLLHPSNSGSMRFTRCALDPFRLTVPDENPRTKAPKQKKTSWSLCHWRYATCVFTPAPLRPSGHWKAITGLATPMSAEINRTRSRKCLARKPLEAPSGSGCDRRGLAMGPLVSPSKHPVCFRFSFDGNTLQFGDGALGGCLLFAWHSFCFRLMVPPVAIFCKTPFPFSFDGTAATLARGPSWLLCFNTPLPFSFDGTISFLGDGACLLNTLFVLL